MKSSLLALSAVFLVTSAASAETLLLNFHSTNGSDAGGVAEPYLSTDPAHSVGGLSPSQTTWNNFNTANSSSSLLNADGSAATGVSITFGGESFIDSGIIDYLSTAAVRTDVNLGTGGGAPGQKNLLGAGSVYGDNTSSTAAGRLGWLGTGNGAAGSAVGLRIDGLTAGEYTIYVMARNTNSNVASAPMGIYAATGTTADTFDFNLLTPGVQLNTGYASASYAGEYNTFTADENYYAITLSIGAGESLFLATAGTGTAETRGFLNMVEIVPVPEGSTVCLLVVGLGLVVFTIRRRMPSAS